MARTITTIPATIDRFTAMPINSIRKRRVAGYARVSTDQDDQQTSYDAQMDYYSNYIKSRGDWEFVGMYSDEGISGTNIQHRAGFNRMVDDALAGKIDLIITKSVSRFARNTVDSLSTVRKLKDKGVEIFFEKENIWTLDSKGELLITIMSSLAQDESRNISENVTWGHRKRFADGSVTLAYGRFLGYDKGEDGNLAVNHEQAKIVKMIYSMFLGGMTCGAIARKLTEMGIKTPGGKDMWRYATVHNILTNEKYKGDALLQKKYTTDFITHKMAVNKGQVPQYYIENNHEAIIDPATFDLVQQEIAKQGCGKMKNTGKYVFSSRIVCGCCGSCYGKKVWHSTDKYKKVVYQCNARYRTKGVITCTSPHFYEDQLKEMFVKAVNQILAEKDEVLDNLRVLQETVADTEALKVHLEVVEQELQMVGKEVDALVTLDARGIINRGEYATKYQELVDKHGALTQDYEQTKEEIGSRKNRATVLGKYIENLAKQPDIVTEFDGAMWNALVDHMTAISKDDISITFKDGTEIKC